MPLIDPQEVEQLLRYCLFTQDEIQDGEPKPGIDWVKVEGITHTFGLVKSRLDEVAPKVNEMLDNLPAGFHADSGGGWGFLEACNDKNGDQWTGMHIRMGELFCLGVGIGRVECLVSRDLWKSLPGGMPYYRINKPEAEVKQNGKKA